MALKNEKWSEDISIIVDNIYEHKIVEPEISKLLQDWDKEGDIDIVFIYLIKLFAVDKDRLCYLAENLRTLSSIDVLLYKILFIKDDDEFPGLASLIIKLTNSKLNVKQINVLLCKVRAWGRSSGVETDDVENYLKYLKGDMEYADIPCWVSIREGENLSLLKTVSPGEKFESIEARNVEFIARAHDLFHEIENKELRGQGVGISLDEAMQSVLSSYSDGEAPGYGNPNRVFGPLNRSHERNCVSNFFLEGPCRMLECLCKEDIDTTSEVIDMKANSWFIGKCQVCLKKIRDPSHAVRYPVKGGSWSGCYCSLECMKEDLNYIDENTNIRLDNLMYTLKEDGIMDRTKV